MLKVNSVLGKARRHKAPNLGCRGAESPEWFDVLEKNSAWDLMHEQACCCDQLPIAVAFWVILIVFIEEFSSLKWNMMQIHCSTCSVILNVIVTQYTCSLNGVYRPHWLVQWSHNYSHMFILVHSPWLPGYIDVAQTILVILTMAGLFPDRLHMPLLHVSSKTLLISLLLAFLSEPLWASALNLCAPNINSFISIRKTLKHQPSWQTNSK